MQIYFYSLIIITGILTITTDIRQRKIKNIHTCIISCIAGISYIVFFSLGQLRMSFPVIINPLVALIIGFMLYISGLWKAGDAKLFFVYALLLPVNRYSTIMPLSCLVLLLGSFLISFIALLPALLSDIINNKNEIIKKAISRDTLLYLIKTFFIVLSVSWLIQPLMHILHIPNTTLLNFVVLFIGYFLLRAFLDIIKHKIIIIIVLASGLLLRFIVMPRFFTPLHLLTFAQTTLFYTGLFYILSLFTNLKNVKSPRIPFSPFMFLGALLASTNFFWWVIGFFH